jgi:hypothetical protein
MSLSTNKIILSGAQTNTPGAYFLTTTLTAVNSGNGTVIPAGVYILIPQVNVSVIASTSNTSNSTVLPANTGGVIISDGVNVFAKSSNAGNDTVTLLATNGGQNVSSTYAS